MKDSDDKQHDHLGQEGGTAADQKRRRNHANVQEFVFNIDAINYKLCKERISIIQYMISDFQRLNNPSEVNASINLLLLKRLQEEDELRRLTLKMKHKANPVGNNLYKANTENLVFKRSRLELTIKEPIVDHQISVARVSSSSRSSSSSSIIVDSLAKVNARIEHEKEVAHILVSLRK